MASDRTFRGREVARRPMVVCLAVLAVGCWLGVACAAEKEKPLPGVDVFVDQPDNLKTRVRIQTDKKGRFEVKGLKPGMYRVVVQVEDLAPGEKVDPQSVGPMGLRNAARWGEERHDYGRIRYVTLYIDPSSSSGAHSMNQRLVNGRTSGIFANVYEAGEALRGRVEGSK